MERESLPQHQSRTIEPPARPPAERNRQLPEKGSPVRPMLNPALRALWRDEQTLQLGVDPERAVVLAGVDARRAAFLSLLDGSRSRSEALAAAGGCGLGPADAAALLDLLALAGALLDGGTDQRQLRALATTERDRLAPDLAAWSLAGSGPDAAARTLRRRRSASVAVRGAGRVGATLVGLLAAAGLGSLTVTDERPLRRQDLTPGGPGPAELEQTRGAAALAAAVTAAASIRPDSIGSADPVRFDLVVLCPDGAYVDPVQRAQLVDEGLPHLLAHTYEQVGVVGPLVLPGRTPCLHCLDLHRVDRDRGWPVVAAQLAGPHRTLGGQRATAACDVVLASSVAAGAAMAVLAFVDDPSATPELGGARLELRPPELWPRRRSWAMHPACSCGWPD